MAELPSSSAKDRECILHTISPENNEESLISPQNYRSWLTLLEAATVRQHEPILNVANVVENEQTPMIYYHRKCRSLFTMKYDLETLKRKASDECIDETDGSGFAKRPDRRSSLCGRVYEETCIFCNKMKYIKNHNTREKLTKAVDPRADKTLRETAVQKGDDRIMIGTSRDIVAAEAHYHLSCYKKYTKKGRHHLVSSNDEKKSNSDEQYYENERKAYDELFTHIRADVIHEKKIVSVTSLTARLELSMQSFRVDNMRDSTRKHIRRTLEPELCDSVVIFQDNKGKLVLLPTCVSIRDTVVENQELLQEIRVLKAKSTDINRVIDKSSSSIRYAIKKEMTPTPWPFHPSDTNNSANTAVPSQLERFLVGQKTGDPDSNRHTSRTTTLVQSFSQDIIYAVTNGQHMPPKHVLLPNAVKTLTWNVELIQTLNKLGHGVSYSQLEENDTALCL